MKDKGIIKGLVIDFDSAGQKNGAVFGFRKMFRDYLNKLGVFFFDPCCPDASTAASTGSFFPTGAPNNITAGTGGAIPVDNYLTTINTDAGGDAFTLADGTQAGQMKKILLVVDGGGNGVVTPATALFGGATTITFNDASDYVILQWNGTAWTLIENSGVAIA